MSECLSQEVFREDIAQVSRNSGVNLNFADAAE
jgi:hypothetical protein